jgi:hypothetical protein
MQKFKEIIGGVALCLLLVFGFYLLIFGFYFLLYLIDPRHAENFGMILKAM